MGKGTQGVRLSRLRGWAHVSTGDLLRAARKAETALGRRAQAYMDQGRLVPDDVIVGVVREHLRTLPAEQGVVFDGFPRTVVQAQALEEVLADAGRQVDRTVLLDADEELLVKRISGRRSSSSGRVYNVYFDPPKEEGVCDETGEPLLHRPDDLPATVRARLKVYRDATEPLVGFYEGKGILERVNGEGGMTEVEEAVRRAVGHATDVTVRQGAAVGTPIPA